MLVGRFAEVFSPPSTSYRKPYIIRLILPDGPWDEWSLAQFHPCPDPAEPHLNPALA